MALVSYYFRNKSGLLYAALTLPGEFGAQVARGLIASQMLGLAMIRPGGALADLSPRAVSNLISRVIQRYLGLGGPLPGAARGSPPRTSRWPTPSLAIWAGTCTLAWKTQSSMRSTRVRLPGSPSTAARATSGSLPISRRQGSAA